MLDTKWIQTTFLYVILAAGLKYSSIVGNSQNYLTWLDKWLKPVTRQSSYWNRCYRATVNGWSSSTFHSNCDGKGPTVTIIRVGKYIFGGYTSVSWRKWHDQFHLITDHPSSSCESYCTIAVTEKCGKRVFKEFKKYRYSVVSKLNKTFFFHIV